MAAGINYNNVWAAKGIPSTSARSTRNSASPTRSTSAAATRRGSSTRWATPWRTVAVGDHVVVHCGQWDVEAPEIRRGRGPRLAPLVPDLGVRDELGLVRPVHKVQAHQCLPKAPQLTLGGGRGPTLVGATAYRMLMGWPPNVVARATPCWCGAGPAGWVRWPSRSSGSSAAARGGGLVRGQGGVLPQARRGRRHRPPEFGHWGMLPHWTDGPGSASGSTARRPSARPSGRRWARSEARRSCSSTRGGHHPDVDLPVRHGGMVVICAGDHGVQRGGRPSLPVDAPEAVPGSHSPTTTSRPRSTSSCWTAGSTLPVADVRVRRDRLAHQLMSENRHPEGNMAALVSAPALGLTDLPG
jgi:crotonyl-CoA carboxylase/reductase